jgi:multidrug resistance efflux pump
MSGLWFEMVYRNLKMSNIIHLIQQRHLYAFKRYVPFVAWVAAAFWAVSTWSDRHSVLMFSGQVVADSWEVSGITTGVVQDIRVKLYENVEEGQLLASLDDSAFLAELEVSRKELTRLESQVMAVETELQSGVAEMSGDWTSDLRRFQVDVQRLRIEVLDLDLQEKKLQANLRGQQDTQESSSKRAEILLAKEAIAETEWQRLEVLSGQGSVAVADANRARRQWLDVVNEKLIVEQELQLANGQVETLDSTLKSLALSGVANQEQLNLAQQRLDEFVDTQPGAASLTNDPRVKTVQDSVNVQTAKLESLAVQYRSLQLRAESTGVVTSILAQPGQSVLPGEALVLLSSATPTQALGWLKQRISHTEINDLKFNVLSAASQEIPVSLVTMAPVFEQLPQVLWANPSVPEYGQPLLFALPPDTGLLPGEPIVLSTLL